MLGRRNASLGGVALVALSLAFLLCHGAAARPYLTLLAEGAQPPPGGPGKARSVGPDGLVSTDGGSLEEGGAVAVREMTESQLPVHRYKGSAPEEAQEPAGVDPRRRSPPRPAWSDGLVAQGSPAAQMDTITTLPDTTLPVTREPPLSTLEEWIVGLRFMVGDRRGLFSVDDLDVLVTPEGDRLLPVYRVMQAFRVPVEVLETDDLGPVKIRLFPSGGKRVTIDVHAQLAILELESRDIAVVRKWSEFRRDQEIYAPEPLLGEALGYSLEWVEAAYEIRAHAAEVPQWYYTERRERMKMGRRTLQDMPENLPEVLPPARPGDFGLQFLEVALSGTYSAVQDLEEKSFYLSRPRERVWARAFGGNLRLDLSQKSLYRGERSRSTQEEDFLVDRGGWEYRGDRYTATLGDAELSLGELVFPSAPMTGARVNWGTSGGSGRHFMPVTVVEDVAPLDSQVDLYVNDQYLSSLRVTDPLKRMPGFGFFRFEGVVLIPGRSNQIRLLITEPSGFRSEILREVWGSTQLLADGEAALIAGVGTYRERTRWDSFGLFAGGQLRYGLLPSLSGELSAGYQYHFLRRELRRDAVDTVQGPEESTHVGVGASWQPHRNAFIKTDLARSESSDENNSDWALRVRGDARLGKATLAADAFHYGSDYFDGQSIYLRDRQGVWATARLPTRQGVNLNAGLGTVRNNLDGNEGETLREDLAQVGMGIYGWLPRTRFEVGADFLRRHWQDKEIARLYNARVESQLTSNLNLDARMYEGDILSSQEHREVVDRLRLKGVPFYVTPYNGARLRWVTRRGFSASLAHWNYRRGRKETLFGLSLSGSRFLRWDFDSQLGKDWWEEDEGAGLAETLVWRGRLNLYPDRSGNRRLSLQSNYRREDWSLVASFNLLEVFGFDGLTPVWLTAERLRPDNGCVLGHVFLDRNGDGRRQPEEPGVEGVGVHMGREKVESDPSGRFLFTRLTIRETPRVSLNLDSLGALYSPTNGTQQVVRVDGALSRAELGVAILGAIVGTVERRGADGTLGPESGVVVAAYDADGVRVKYSVTATDGTYYLGELKPGLYWLQIERDSLGLGLRAVTPPQKVTMISGVDAPIDERVDFIVEEGRKAKTGQVEGAELASAAPEFDGATRLGTARVPSAGSR